MKGESRRRREARQGKERESRGPDVKRRVLCLIFIFSREITMSATARRKRPPDHEVKNERMKLIGADRDAFLDAVLKPPQPTDKLVAALRHHRRSFG
jgi:hypothetical protein